LIVTDFSSDEVYNILKREKIDAVIHFAAFADVADSMTDPDKYYQNNIFKTKKLLGMMKETNVRRIVFSSSAAIFGNPVYTPIDEEHIKKPINPYGTTKLIDELMLEDYRNCFGFQFASLRYFNACGADIDSKIGESHSPEHHLIPLILNSIKHTKETFYVYGNNYDTPDKTPIRDYIHVMDLAEAHYLAFRYLLNQDSSLYLNMGSNTGYSVLDVFNQTMAITGKKIDFEYKPRRPGDPAVLIASNQLAKKILNWEPKYSDLNTIIKSAWNWENNRRY